MRKLFHLKTYIKANGELSPAGRKLLIAGSLTYLVLLFLMCFLPQTPEEGMETPGIQYFGRVSVLLYPLNSLIHIGEISSWEQFVKVFVQNLMNIFLLSPLLFQFFWLFPKFRNPKKVLLTSFLMSLFIECSQIILDLLFQANRVFEIDDLWTNTLGGYLAYLVFIRLLRMWQKRLPER